MSRTGWKWDRNNSCTEDSRKVKRFIGKVWSRLILLYKNWNPSIHFKYIRFGIWQWPQLTSANISKLKKILLKPLRILMVEKGLIQPHHVPTLVSSKYQENSKFFRTGNFFLSQHLFFLLKSSFSRQIKSRRKRIKRCKKGAKSSANMWKNWNFV